MCPRCFAIRLDYFFICSGVCMCVCDKQWLLCVLSGSDSYEKWDSLSLKDPPPAVSAVWWWDTHTHTQPHILTHKRSLTHAHNQHTFSFFTHIVSVSHTQTKRDKKWEERCFFLIRLACTILYFLSLDCSLLLSVFNTFLDIVAKTHVNTPRGLINRELCCASLTSHLLEQDAELQVCVCVFPDHSTSEGQVKGIKGIVHPKMKMNTN